MNNRTNYALVGFIVLTGVALMLGFTYWMLKPTVDSKMKNYTIYFDESVLGLNIDAPVKYRGIAVGKVSGLQINSKNAEQVDVTVEILKSTPIKASTVAQLTAQGITGLTYINLTMIKHSTLLLTKKSNEKYPVIKTVPSFFENFENSFGSVSSKLSSTLGKTEKLLGQENQEQMSLLLKRTANIMQKLEVALDDKTVNHLQSSVKNIDSFTSKLDNMMPNIDTFIGKSVNWENNISTSFSSIMNSYLGIRSSMDEIKRAISSGEFNVKDITADVVPTINSTFLEMNELMIKFDDVLNEYGKSPSDIFYKTQEVKKAPGEK